MTTDLRMLAATTILAALLILPYGLVMWARWPIGAILGNRGGRLPALPAEGGRRGDR